MRSIRNRLLSIRRNRQRELNGLAIHLAVRIGLSRNVPSNPTIQVFYYTNLHQLFLVIADFDFERFVKRLPVRIEVEVGPSALPR
jgi:hypothetical protein